MRAQDRWAAKLAPLLAVCALLTACPSPNAIQTNPNLTVSSLLSGATSALLTNLPCGRSVDAQLGQSRSALVALNLQQEDADRATLGVQAAGSGAQTQSFGLMSLDDAAWRSPPTFEPRPGSGRRLPAAGYHLQQVATTPHYQLGSEDKFWVIADLEDGDSTEIQVPAKATYVGTHCYVFVDEQLTDTSLAPKLQQIGQTFDAQIFPTDTRIFGEPVSNGVNGDPRISLLVSPVVGNYGKDNTIGYFALRDLFAPGADPSDPTYKHSNQRLMLYVSPYVISSGLATDYLGTIAHEFQHLINASQKLFHNGAAGAATAHTEDVWLDEALAMYAMEANGYGLAGNGSVVFNHVAAYLATPSAYSLVDWANSPDGSSYGAGYLFTTYLADRFGQGILKELVTSTQTGIDNVNARLAARQTNFRQVFVDWTAANLLGGTNLSPDPRYNYRTINLLGTYGAHRLGGMRLAPVKVPTNGSLTFKAFSAQYLYMAPTAGPTLHFSLAGSESQNFGGLVVSP